MQLKYGTYLFPSNSCDIKARQEVSRNRGGVPYSVKNSLEVEGFLYGDGQSAISAQMQLLKNALSSPYNDLIFYQDDGSESNTYLKNAGSISGVVVTEGPNFMNNDGGEYSTYRKYSFKAEAEYPILGTNNLLLFFSEELSFSGGGPIYTHKLAINGPPQKQLVYPKSIYRVIQRGEAIGYKKYPTAPGPIWPQALMMAPDIQQKSPDLMGKGYQSYGLSWSYTFESAVRLVGVPNLWRF